MSNRWAEYQDDSSRLPDGFTRVAYDADTQQYTFKDRNGQLYKGEPGADYGTLTPIGGPSSSSFEQSRPRAFATSHSRSQSLPYPPGAPPKTFGDILPPDLMTTSSLSEQPSRKLERGSSGRSREQFINAVKKSTLPKMQNVVHSLKRSMTSIKKNSRPPIPSLHRRRGFETLDDPEVDDQEGLLRKSTLRSGNLNRSDTTSTTQDRKFNPNAAS